MINKIYWRCYSFYGIYHLSASADTGDGAYASKRCIRHLTWKNAVSQPALFETAIKAMEREIREALK